MEIGLVSLSMVFLTFRRSFSTPVKDHDIRNLLRDKRYLVYPNPGGSETKVQVLFGLSLPMEGDVSMTLGYVFKCNYNLPYNASDYKSAYIENARRSRKAVSRGKRTPSSEVTEIHSNPSGNAKMLFPKDFGKAQLMLLLVPFMLRQVLIACYSYEISKDPRMKRHLAFTPSGTFAPTKTQIIIGLGLPMEGDYNTVIGYVMKLNYRLPSNISELREPYVYYARSSNKSKRSISIGDVGSKETSGLTRYDLYNMITSMDSFRLNKACLLKTICEAAEASLRKSSGLLPELLHILLTPSSTQEQINDPTDREYLAAEILGRNALPGHCAEWFPECKCDVLEYFTQIVSH